MNTDTRDKFLTEAMGECWHKWYRKSNFIEGHHCKHCDKYWPVKPVPRVQRVIQACNFDTWDGFGKLWEWAQKQEWWFKFWYHTTAFDHAGNEIAFPRDAPVIHPGRFANAVYFFLKTKV